MKASEGLVKAVLVLFGGTAAGSIVTALAMPILSRLYDPADFGTLAVFTGIVTTVAVAACLRFDVAVALPESDEESVALLLLSVVSAFCVALVALLAVAIWFDRFSGWITDPGIHSVKWLIPVGIFSAAAWSALQSWHIRRQNYGLIAKGRLGQSTISAATQAGGAFFGQGSLALVLGPTVAFLSTGMLFLERGRKDILSWPRRDSINRLRRTATAYRRFPIYSTWEALFNQAAIHLPIIYIAGVTTASEAGFIMLAMYVLQAPMSLLGGAIAQAYLSRAPEAFRSGNLVRFTDEVLMKLIKVGAGPIVAVGIVSPGIFPLLFGADWGRAGWLVSWMTPWFLLQFLVSPISMSLHVINAQRTAMLLQMSSLLMRMGMTWLAVEWLYERVAEVYALSGGAAYLVYLIVVQIYLGDSDKSARSRLFGAAVRWVSPWIIVSLVVAYAVSELASHYAN